MKNAFVTLFWVSLGHFIYAFMSHDVSYFEAIERSYFMGIMVVILCITGALEREGAAE